MTSYTTVLTLLSLAFAVATNAQSATAGGTSAGSTATPSGPVLSVTFPGGVDHQTLVGSVVGTASSLTTVVITCPDGTDSNDCGFDPAVTFTQGPSTAAFVYNAADNAYMISETCKFSGGTATCVVTEIGDSVDFGTDASGVGTALSSGSTTLVSTITLSGTDVETVPVTITAGRFAGATTGPSQTGSSSSSASGSSTGRSSSGARSTGGTASTQSTASSTSSSNDVAALVPGSVAVGVMGLAALLL